VVTVNGEVLEPASFGAPRRLDPGAYVVRAEAPGYQPWERALTVENEQHRKLVVPPLAPLHPTVPKSAPASESATGAKSPPTWVYVSGGAGLAGLLLGASAGAVALSRKSDVAGHCPRNACDAAGLEALDSGRSAATLSNIGFGVGVVGLSGAAVGWVLNRSSNEPRRRASVWVPRLVVAPKGGQLSFAGDFE
jgi:hypothetical protein